MLRTLNLNLFCILLFLMLSSSASAKDSLSISMARKLASAGLYDSAGVMYQDIRALQDSLFYSNYDSAVEKLYDSNQIDEQEMLNKKTISRILFMVGIVAILLLAIILFSRKIFKRRTASLEKSRTELAVAQKLAEISVANKSTAISNMSHEIKTPLNSIVGFSSLLAEGGLDEDTCKQCAEIINLNSELLLKLINDVVDISCLDLNNISFNLRECDAVSIGKEVVDSFKKLKVSLCDIFFDCDFHQYVIDTDPVRLQQVLFNLMSNAVKFCKEGSITLSITKKDEKFLQFSVTDTGAGIPVDKQSTIFNRYERVDEMAPGAGIGLSLCQLIVKRLGGTIWIDSAYTSGARFIFIHPISQEVVR